MFKRAADWPLVRLIPWSSRAGITFPLATWVTKKITYGRPARDGADGTALTNTPCSLMVVRWRDAILWMRVLNPDCTHSAWRGNRTMGKRDSAPSRGLGGGGLPEASQKKNCRCQRP